MVLSGRHYCRIPENKVVADAFKTNIIVMDNMHSHYAKAVKQLLDSTKVNYLYLPPYSPDLNSIEKMWSKLKRIGTVSI